MLHIAGEWKRFRISDVLVIKLVEIDQHSCLLSVIRGCASDFSVDVCKGLERTQCQVCDEDDCNGISELRLRSCVDKVIFDTVLLVIVIVYATFML